MLSSHSDSAAHVACLLPVPAHADEPLEVLEEDDGDGNEANVAAAAAPAAGRGSGHAVTVDSQGTQVRRHSGSMLPRQHGRSACPLRNLYVPFACSQLRFVLRCRRMCGHHAADGASLLLSSSSSSSSSSSRGSSKSFSTSSNCYSSRC